MVSPIVGCEADEEVGTALDPTDLFIIEDTIHSTSGNKNQKDHGGIAPPVLLVAAKDLGMIQLFL